MNPLATLTLTWALLGSTAGPEPDRPWPKLEGRWAFVQVTAAVSDAPLIGEVTSETRAVGMLDVIQDGPRLALTERVCALETSSQTRLVRTSYPKAFLSALSGNVRRARLEKVPDGGFRFHQPRAWDVKGSNLDDPAGDPLPTELDDPRLVDADEDGHPGLTVRINGIVSGDLRVVTRGWTELDGEVVRDSLISGTLRWRTEQRIVDTTNALLSHQPKPEPHPDPRRSWFAMARMDDAATCAEVRSRAVALPHGSP